MRDIAAATVADDEQGQRGWWRLETRSEGAEDAEPDRAGYIYGLRSEGPDYRQTRFRKCLASVCPLENRVFYVQSLSVPDLWAVVSSAECCASPEDSDPWPISPDRVLQYILFPTLDYLHHNLFLRHLPSHSISRHHMSHPATAGRRSRPDACLQPGTNRGQNKVSHPQLRGHCLFALLLLLPDEMATTRY